MFFFLSRPWDKEKILSPGARNRTTDLRSPRSDALQTKPQRLYGEQGPLRSSYMTRVLHTAKISNVDSIMFINRIRKIVGFELVKEIEKDVFVLSRTLNKEKILSFSLSLIGTWQHIV